MDALRQAQGCGDDAGLSTLHCGMNMQITLSTAATPSHIRKMTYTDPRSYLYQPGLLDPDAAQAQMREHIRNTARCAGLQI